MISSQEVKVRAIKQSLADLKASFNLSHSPFLNLHSQLSELRNTVFTLLKDLFESYILQSRNRKVRKKLISPMPFSN